MRRSLDCVIEIYLLLAAIASNESLSLIIKPLEYCPHPDQPFNGFYLPNSEKLMQFDNVTYFCKQPYTLIGKETITCRPNHANNGFVWSDPAPFCDMNATLTKASLLTYEGQYIPVPRFQDGNSRTCVNLAAGDIWLRLAKPGYLHTIRVFLGTGRAIINIRAGKALEPGLRPGFQSFYTCITDFKMEEGDQWILIQCDRDNGLVDAVVFQDITEKRGSWHVLTLCEVEVFVREEDSCTKPPDIQVSNGYFEFNRSAARLICEEGFKSANTTRLTCEKDTWNSARLQCEGSEENECPLGDTDCPTAAYCNRTRCKYVCEGACGSNSLCKAEDHRPICSCAPGFSGDPFDTVRGCIKDISKCKELDETDMLNIHYTQDREIGSYATFHCFAPAKRSGVPFAKCLDDASWSDPAPTCHTTGCPLISAVAPPLKVILQPPEHPVTAIYRCPTNYSLSGQSFSVCVSGKWSSNVPVCQLKCPNLSSPVNGRLEFSSNDLVEGVTAEIICLSGYQVSGQKILTCTSGGSWSRDLPICEPACQDPGTPVNGRLEFSSSDLLESVTAEISCFPGYQLLGQKVLTCMAEGNWSHDLPICVPKCRTFSAPVNGRLVFSSSDLVEGVTAEIACLAGYQVLGHRTLTCTRGNWSHDIPSCVEACAVPPIPTRGFVRYLPPTRSNLDQISETYRSRIQQLKAPLVLPSTSDPANASLPAEVHRVGTRAMFSCESRYYKLLGSRTRWCQERGEWSGTPSICIPVCGHSNSPRSPVIVNGNSTEIGEWPWQAGISRYMQEYRGWYLVCGASLLNELWVITAAHCVTYLGTTLILEEDKFRVYLGKYHRDDSKDDEYVQVRKIQRILVHPDYQPALLDSDIALIKLELAVQLNSRVQPICLPTEKTTRDNLIPGKRGVVTGWGLNENETYSETLQQAVLPAVSHETCEKGYEESGIPQTLTDNMFCAGYAQGKINACGGDSGGPMVFPDESSKEKKWILEGIVSWASPEGCGNPNQYAGFTIVSIFLDWIYLYL